jgi:hypothetical protein
MTNPYANKKKTPPGFARLMQPALKKSWLETDSLKEVEEWQNKVIKKLFTLEEDWLKANLFKAGIPADAGAKIRCKIVKQDKAHIWNTTLYIDDKIVSILSVNSVTMEATVSNNNGFTSSENI